MTPAEMRSLKLRNEWGWKMKIKFSKRPRFIVPAQRADNGRAVRGSGVRRRSRFYL